MKTQPVLAGADLEAYHQYLQSDHDYTVQAQILPLDESRVVREIDLLDGQVNHQRGQEGPMRTASLKLSDPEGALNYGVSFTKDDSNVLWVNRIIRVRHSVVVPGIGKVSCTPFIGLPTAVSQDGGEIDMELADKSILADHGVRPRTYKKGARVDLVLRSLLEDLTGEKNFRIPTTKKTLSRPYSVGMGENTLTPWQAFVKIAKKEGPNGGWKAFYSSDGYATCIPRATQTGQVKINDMLALPKTSASLTDFSNYVKVTSVRKIVNKKKTKRDETVKGQWKLLANVYNSVTMLPPAHDLSESSLSRNGVVRTLPLIISDNDLKNQKEVAARARLELLQNSGLDAEPSYEIIPMFHLDPYDKVVLPSGVGAVEFDKSASVPLGTGGNMTIGTHRWVSRPVSVRKTRSWKNVKKRKRRGGGSNG